MESKKSVGGTSHRDQVRMIQLKPLWKMNFDAKDLPQTWRLCMKEKIVPYMELAMAGQQEITKVKFILYLVGSQG